MHLVHTNRTWWSDPTIRVSTINLPIKSPYNGHFYETCVFTVEGSEVVKTYSSAYAARLGHHSICSKYGIRT